MCLSGTRPCLGQDLSGLLRRVSGVFASATQTSLVIPECVCTHGAQRSYAGAGARWNGSISTCSRVSIPRPWPSIRIGAHPSYGQYGRCTCRPPRAWPVNSYWRSRKVWWPVQEGQWAVHCPVVVNACLSAKECHQGVVVLQLVVEVGEEYQGGPVAAGHGCGLPAKETHQGSWPNVLGRPRRSA